MIRTFSLVVILLLVFPTEWVQAQIKISEPPAIVPHRKFALDYLEEHGHAGATPEQVDVEALIDAEFIRFDLGLYDLRFPIEDLSEEESAGNLKEIALALLRSQELFAEWVDAHEDRIVRADFKTIRQWITAWKPRQLERAAKQNPSALAVGLKASPAEIEALARFADWMRTAAPVKLNRLANFPARMIFMPTRPRFLKFVCFAGWKYPDLKSKFWDDGLGTWLGCRVQKTQIVALQYASPDISKADFELGLPLNYKHPDVMQQHAVHFGMQALFDNYYQDSLPPFASTGLAMNLVLEQFGDLKTRIEGDLRARFTESFAAFVPGGNSGGGTLPPYNPDGRWRETLGVGHFLSLLQKCQEKGNGYVQNKKNRNLKFQIIADDERAKTSQMAPFLGTAALNNQPPEQKFMGDYQEFFRAYKSGFLWWLQTEAAGSKKRCAKVFTQLLQERSLDPVVSFEELLLKIYESPLSEERPGNKSLEGQFLLWLTKQ
ncbi:MAG: hypothetical protein ACI8TQ_001389 [Planctomycetota bacterium]|jgi:hypothetical protein